MGTNKNFYYEFMMTGLLFAVVFILVTNGARAQTSTEDTSAISPVSVQEATPTESITENPQPVSVQETTPTESITTESPPSEENAETYFRRGVGLYKKELYREALTEFNRALALDPNHKEAQVYQQKCNAQLQLSIGRNPKLLHQRLKPSSQLPQVKCLKKQQKN